MTFQRNYNKQRLCLNTKAVIVALEPEGCNKNIKNMKAGIIIFECEGWIHVFDIIKSLNFCEFKLIFICYQINSSNNKLMGGNQVATFQQGQPLSNYDVIQKLPQQNVSYLKHKTSGKQYMIKQSAINDRKQYAQLCQKLKNRQKLHSQHLTKLERFSQQFEDHLCSSFHTILAMWEYPTHTLRDELDERALQKRRFEEKQMFSIIASVIQGMSCLQSSGIKHQSLTATSILFDQTGMVKVADPLTLVQAVNFQRVNCNRKIKGIPIAPQQCQSLKNQRPISNRNPFKSAVFILGVISLECGLLQQMDSLFIEQFEDIDYDQLAKRLQQFGRIYNSDLRVIVQTMLTKDPKDRMDWIGLKQYIPQKDQWQREGELCDNVTPGSKLFRAQIKDMISALATFSNRLAKGQNAQSHFSVKLPHNQIQNQCLYDQQSANSLNDLYAPLYTQPGTLNPAFSQPIQSFTYQPSSGTLNPGNQDTKTSNYTYDTKAAFQRPTEQYLGQTVPCRINKVGLNNPSVDRQLPPVPFNSHFQLKRDYFTTGTTSGPLMGNNNNAISSAYAYKAPIYGQANEYPSTSVNTITQRHYTSQDQARFTLPKFSQATHMQSSPFVLGKRNFQLGKDNHQKLPSKNEKTRKNSNNELDRLPFMISNYVKEAKSITQEKMLQESHINEHKPQQQAANSQQQYSQGNYSSEMQQICRSQSGNQKTEKSNNYYQPISRLNNDANTNTIKSNLPQSNTYLISANATLRQGLHGGAEVAFSAIKSKQKPKISSLNEQPLIQNQQQKAQYYQHNFTQQQIKHRNHTQQYERQYQYKPINHSRQQPNPGIAYSQKYMSDNNELQYVIQNFKQGSRYEGTKYQDMRHGQGKFFYQDGGMYQGNWRFNQMDGFGKLYYQSGMIAYEGNWKQDQFQAYGKLYNEQPDQLHQMFNCQNFDLIDQFWAMYEGNFVSDQKDGQGKMVFSNGEYFIGDFHRDMVDGRGEFHRLDNQVIKGVWSQNKLVEQE